MKGINIHSVVVNGMVYVGGGLGGDDDYIVMEYNIQSEKWNESLLYTTCDFAMTVINGRLVLVGGEGDEGEVVSVWEAERRTWTQPYPKMKTARSLCSAFVHKNWLVVAGGRAKNDELLSSVEVMNIDSKQWCAGPPTPTKWHSMKTVIAGDECYFMGGHAANPEGKNASQMA